MCAEVMGDQNGLRVLHVSASGHDRIPRQASLFEQRVHNVKCQRSNVSRLVAQIHADERSDLIVA